MTLILHITDMQGDFGNPKGKLFVPNGDKVAAGIDKFMDEMPEDIIDGTLATYDTHPWFAYYASDECIAFPEIHCEQGTSGWDLVVDVEKHEVKLDVAYIPKEKFDVWEDRASSNIDVKTLGVIGSNMGYMMFLQDMQNKGASFLDRSVSRDDFGKAVGFDFDKEGTGYKGKITVYPYDPALEGKIKEGFYVFDGDNGKEIVAIANKNLIDVYNNIGQICLDLECKQAENPRDAVLNKGLLNGTTVLMTGLATNFCVFDAMKGYLDRGAEIIVLEDLMSGIPCGQDMRDGILAATGVDRTVTGDIKDVLETDSFKDYVADGKIKIMKSSDFLDLARKHAQTPPANDGKPPRP